MNKSIFFLLLFFVCIPFPSPHLLQASQQTFRLVLQWTPQAQFAGYLVALEKGFYKEQGIDLEIVSGGPDMIVSDALDSGRAEFGTMFLATALERRDAGVPLVNIGQLIHHSSLILVTRADSGVRTIADLKNKKVSIWANEFQIQPRLLFRRAGIEVEFIPLASSMDLFLRGGVTATLAMWYNEYHTILSAGVRKDELRPFFFKDTPYDFPEDGIYCLEKEYKQNPAAARAVLAATLKGWRYAFAHEQETLALVTRVMTEAKLPVNMAHQRWMFRRMRDIFTVGGHAAENGVLSRKNFLTTMQQLLEGGILRSPVEFDTFYRGPSRR